MKAALANPVYVIITREDQVEIKGFAKIDPHKFATTVNSGGNLYVIRPDGSVRWWPSIHTPSKDFLGGSWRLANLAEGG